MEHISKYSKLRVGIYPGAFNPVHAGHITFALQALRTANLDQVIFLPERLPLRGGNIEHFGHRTAMLNRAIRPHPDLAVLEISDKRFSFGRTWPKVQSLFPGAQLVLLTGSDVIVSGSGWPDSSKLLRETEIVIGLLKHSSTQLYEAINRWSISPRAIYVVRSFAPNVSSSLIREAIGEKRFAEGLLASVKQYCLSEWLYVSIKDI
jgi:nicotinate-nucleotide adenylyltransferase